MQNFTPDDVRPSEKTLNFIRQFAQAYRLMAVNGRRQTICIN